MTLPAWMQQVDAVPCPGGNVRAGKKGFMAKTLDGLFKFLGETLTSESYSRRTGLLQSLDPRAKLVSILALIVATTTVKDLYLLLVVYGLILAFALLSKINLLFFIERVWLFIPIFTGVIILPMIFNVVMPGDRLVDIVSFGAGAHVGPLSLPESVYITKQGLLSALTFTIRVATCVSAIVLLFLTTPQERLFKSFRSLGVPRVYVLTLDMCYRYIFLFIDVIRGMFIAKKSRTIRYSGTLAEQRWVAGRIGYTMIKTLDLSDKVHKAMISRGFTGDVKIMEDFRFRARDAVATVAVLSFSVLLVLISQNYIRM
jgi:cobalt/nickel transport system permease protein